MTSPIQEPVHWKRKKNICTCTFLQRQNSYFFVKSKISKNLHFDSRGVVSVKSPHSSRTGTSSPSSHCWSGTSTSSCGFSLTNSSSATSTSWRTSRWWSTSTSDISCTCSRSGLKNIILGFLINKKKCNEIRITKFKLEISKWDFDEKKLN